MIVLGIDPGKTIGWCLLKYYPSGNDAAVVDVGAVKSDWHTLVVGLDTFRAKADVVAVERPVAGKPAALTNIIGVAEQAGCIAGYFTARGYDTMLFTSFDWRKAVVGNRTAKDAAIANAILGQVANLPQRTNNHQRDAIGVALHAARLAMTRKGAN